MLWPLAGTFLAHLDAKARRALLRILQGPANCAPKRSAGLFARQDGEALSALLIELHAVPRFSGTCRQV